MSNAWSKKGVYSNEYPIHGSRLPVLIWYCSYSHTEFFFVLPTLTRTLCWDAAECLLLGQAGLCSEAPSGAVGTGQTNSVHLVSFGFSRKCCTAKDTKVRMFLLAVVKVLFLRVGQFDLLPNKVLVMPSPVKFAFFYLGLVVDPAIKICSKGREASVHPHGHTGAYNISHRMSGVVFSCTVLLG